MQKNRGFAPIVAVCGIVTVIFLLVALLVPFERTYTFWAAFVFGLMALVVALGANLYVILGSRSLRSAFYRTSVSTMSFIYLIVAIVVDLVFMAASSLPMWPLILIQAILLALCAIGLIGGNATADFVERSEDVTQGQTSAIRELRMQAQALEAMPMDPAGRAALKKLTEELRFTDPMSSAACAPYDQRLLMDMGQLYTAVNAQESDAVEQISARMASTIAQRAAVCRASKG